MFKKVSWCLKIWSTAWFGKRDIISKLILSGNKLLCIKTLKILNIQRHTILSCTYPKTLINGTFICAPLDFAILIIENGVTLHKNLTLAYSSFVHFVGINFRNLSFTKDSAEINFRDRNLYKDFEGIKSHGCLKKHFFRDLILWFWEWSQQILTLFDLSK